MSDGPDIHPELKTLIAAMNEQRLRESEQRRTGKPQNASAQDASPLQMQQGDESMPQQGSHASKFRKPAGTQAQQHTTQFDYPNAPHRVGPFFGGRS